MGNKYKGGGNNRQGGGSPEGGGGQPLEKKIPQNKPPEKQPQQSPVERIVQQMNEKYDGFSKSIESTIDTLHKKDFTKHNEPGQPDATKAITHATESIQAINGYIRLLEEVMPHDEGTGLQIESLLEQRDRLYDAINGYNYRMTHELASGEDQINDLLAQVTNGTLPESQLDRQGRETNQQVIDQRIRFKKQADLTESYSNLIMANEIIKKVFTQYELANIDGTKIASFADVSGFVDDLTRLGDSSKWSEEENSKARTLLEPLQKLFDTPIFGDKAKEKYEALKRGLEDSTVKKTFTENGIRDEKGRIFDLDFVIREVGRFARSTDASKWDDKDVNFFLGVTRALKELSNLPASGNEVQQALDALRTRIQTTIEASLKTDKIPTLQAQGEALLENSKSDKELSAVMAQLDKLFSEETISENGGWIILSKEAATEFIEIVRENKEKIISRWSLFKLESSDEKRPKIDFCQAVENFAKDYAKKQAQLKRLLPIINELQLVNTFGKTKQEATTETPEPAAA